MRGAEDISLILTAHQVPYLPWLGLFHKIALADKFVSFDQVQYSPRDWTTRNKIMTTKGPMWLSVPVKKNFGQKLCEVEICEDMNWQRKHWASIRLNYSRAPFFAKYANYFENHYLRSVWCNLDHMNNSMLDWFLRQLGINIEIRFAGAFRFKGEKSALVLDMCKQLGANKYIFGIQGKEYCDVKAFRDAGVKPIFQNYIPPQYSTWKGESVPNLSIIDLLFNHGPNSLDILMSGNLTKEQL